MKSRLLTGIGVLVVAIALMISAVTAQEATPEATPQPEATQEAASPRPYLGVRITASEDPAQPGVVILAVDPRSPAAEAGLEAGDVITAVDGSAVTAPEDVVTAIADRAIGDTVSLEIVRNGETRTVEAVLAEFPQDAVTLRFGAGPRGNGRGEPGGVIPIDPEQLPEMFRFFMQPGMGMFPQNGRLGVVFITLDAQVAAERGVDLTEGALIVEVDVDSPAAQAGLEVGDVVTAVNGEPVNQEITLRDRLIAYEPEDTVTLTVVRAGETREIAVTLGQPLQPAMDMLPFEGMPPFNFGQPDGERGGLGGLLPPGHPPIPLIPADRELT